MLSGRETYRRLRGSANTIKTVYVGALTLYSLVGTALLHGWANVAAVAAILVGSPLAVLVVMKVLSARDPFSELLRATPVLRSRVDGELERANDQGASVWWHQSEFESRWFDTLFAFWWKAQGVPATDVALVVDQPALVAKMYNDVPVDETQPARPERKKAALVKTSTFFSDVPPTLHCAPVDYELAMWVDRHGREFRSNNPEATLYGVTDWLPYPAVICTHNVITTGDGWILVSLRNSRTDFFPNTWSVSFEEQVEIGVGGNGVQLDSTIEESVRRGLKEEFGAALAADAVNVTTLAVGREHADTETRSVRSCAVVNIVTLQNPLKSVWASLSQPGHVEDIGESAGWMAWRFTRRADVIEVLRRHPPHANGIGPATILGDHRFAVEVSVHQSSRERLEGQGFGWHPTSRPRLLLWAEWATVNGVLTR